MNRLEQDDTINGFEEYTPAGGADNLQIKVVFSPDHAAVGQVFEVQSNAPNVAIGRDVAEHGVAIADPRMSKLHFRIVHDRREGLFRLGDALSHNGTYLNGVRTTTEVLQHSSVIRAGGTIFAIVEPAGLDATLRQAKLAARTGFPILILGETGAGKERFAHLIHDESQRAGALVAVNCAALQKELASADLFGHTKNAFSGATAARAGLFRESSGGTLFLDEIGDLPLAQQALLLRVLQEGKVRPVGSDQEYSVDSRIVSATNMNLREAVDAGLFRQDLYARLAQIVLVVPPLRHRRTEILSLLFELAAKAQVQLDLNPDAAEALLLYDWPSNVREVQSLVHSLAIHGPAVTVTRALLAQIKAELRDIPRTRSSLPPLMSSTTNSEPAIEREMLKSLLRECDGNILLVSKKLGIHRSKLYRWIRKYALSADDFR